MLPLLSLGAAFSSPARSLLAPRAMPPRSPAIVMPEGPECRLHAETLHRRLQASSIRRASILSGRYLGNGSVAGRRAPPERWDLLCSSLPAEILAIRVSSFASE